MNKRVLIITYYWPPSGGPGVGRVLKFVKYLTQLGWTPIVLTIKDGEYPALDPTLLKEVPDDCIVYKTKSFEFFSLFKKLTGRKKDQKIETYILNKKEVGWKDKFFRWIRFNFFIPDARIGWKPYAVQEGMAIIEKEKPDLIFSTSPPHSVQLIARRLAKKSGLKWVADFRDPWMEAFWLSELKNYKRAHQRNYELERAVVKDADVVVTVSAGFRELLLKGENHDVRIIPNGFDSDDFDLEKEPSSKFRISYAGHIASTQNPENFFEALSRLNPAEIDQLHIRFYGYFDESVIESIKKYDIEGVIEVHGYVPHKEAIQLMKNSDLLILLNPRNHDTGILPGKLFEYMATNNPILGIGDISRDISAVLEETGTGKMYSFEDDLTGVIRNHLEAWKKHQGRHPENPKINRYYRKELTKDLIKIFEELCA